MGDGGANKKGDDASHEGNDEYSGADGEDGIFWDVQHRAEDKTADCKKNCQECRECELECQVEYNCIFE